MALHYLGILVALTSLAMIIFRPSEIAVWFFTGAVAFSALAWFLALFKRRSAICPLCKGTPLVNGGAGTHVRAKRLPPLNHGTTAVISILAAQKFRCMYCGSDFDLLKPSARSRHAAPNDWRSLE